MESIKKMQFDMLRKVILVICFISGASVFIMDEPLGFIYGLVFGSGISLLNFFELANTLNRAVLMRPDKAQSFTVIKYFIRYIVTAIVVYISIVAPYINVLGTILGLIIIKLIILVSNLLGDKNYFKKIFRRKEDESSGQ
jgi:hypothetical protein